MSTTVSTAQAQLVHDALIRVLNLHPSQVRARAFSVTWEPDSAVVSVTWDGQALLEGPTWDRIVHEAGLTPSQA